MRDSIFLRELPKAIVLNLLLAIAGAVTFFVGFESLVVLRLFGPIVFAGLLAAIFLLLMEGWRTWKQWKPRGWSSDDGLGFLPSNALNAFSASALMRVEPLSFDMRAPFRPLAYAVIPALIGVSWIFRDDTVLGVSLRTIGALGLLIAAVVVGIITVYRFFKDRS